MVKKRKSVLNCVVEYLFSLQDVIADNKKVLNVNYVYLSLFSALVKKIYMKKLSGLWLHQFLMVSMEQSLHMGRQELAKRTRWKVGCIMSLSIPLQMSVIGDNL
jgi:hypothetical protein